MQSKFFSWINFDASPLFMKYFSVNWCKPLFIQKLQVLAYCNNNNAIILFGRGSFPEYNEKHGGKSICGGECHQVRKQE